MPAARIRSAQIETAASLANRSWSRPTPRASRIRMVPLWYSCPITRAVRPKSTIPVPIESTTDKTSSMV